MRRKAAAVLRVCHFALLMQNLSRYVSRTVEIIFPGVAERMRASAKWQYGRWRIRPMFGLFYNLCVNGIFPHQSRIHCEPHLDFKNVVGVCALLVYQDPSKPKGASPMPTRSNLIIGTPFNHRLRSWVVLWEAGVAIELPPWVILIYPSSLLHHFNVDALGELFIFVQNNLKRPLTTPMTDFQFVMVDGTERPTPENSTPIVDVDGRGRGTFVYFNQSSMYQSAETDSDTLADAKRAHKKTTVSYPDSIKTALENYSYVYNTASSPPHVPM